MQRLYLSLSLLLALTCAATAQEQAREPETFTYAEIEGHPLQLDLHRGEAETPTPLVIWIHGGAWMSGSRKHVPRPVRTLLNEGVSIASIDYRLTSQAGRWGKAPVHWPAQRDDAKAAVRWLRAHAGELNLDPGAFVAWGDSAGGHLAATLGLTNDAPGTTGEVGEHTEISSCVSLAINFYGPSELLSMNQNVTRPPGSTIDHEALDSPESIVLGARVHGHTAGEIREHAEDPRAPWPELIARARSASPLHAVVPAHARPLYTAHGRMDTVVAFAQGERLHRRLQELKLSSTWRPVERAGHGFGPAIYREAISWMRKALAEEEQPGDDETERPRDGDDSNQRREQAQTSALRPAPECPPDPVAGPAIRGSLIL